MNTATITRLVSAIQKMTSFRYAALLLTMAGLQACGNGDDSSATLTTPQSPNVIETQLGVVSLTWTAVAGTTRYEIWRGPNTNASAENRIAENVEGTTYIDRTVGLGQTYNYRLVACNASGCSERSESAVITIGGPPTPGFTPGTNEAVVYYLRADGNYTGWVLHLWNSDQCTSYTPRQLEGVVWPDGPAPTGVDPVYGAYWQLELVEGYDECANYIIHNQDEKDPDANDQLLDLSTETNPSRWAFAISGVGIFSSPQLSTNIPVTISGASAHWLDASTILWNPEDASERGDVRLHFSDNASLSNISDVNSNPASQQLNLSEVGGGLTTAQRELVPHLVENWIPFTHTATNAEVRNLLRQQLVLASYDSNGNILKATRVQSAKVLDDLYTSGTDDADERELGARYTTDGNIALSVWAPTVTDLKLKVYNDDDDKTLNETLTMSRDDATGVWSYTGTQTDLNRMFYRYEITTFHYRTNRIETYEATDPYSLSLAANSRYSQFVNLNDDDLKPSGWEAHTAPVVDNFEDLVIYESHIRDFSIRDSSVSSANRGKYLAFTESGAAGMVHLAKLNQAGMNTFHVLPSFDYSTVNEIASERIGLTNTVAQLCAVVGSAPVCSDGTDSTTVLLEVFESYDPDVAADETKAQALTQSMRNVDGFNWGYDPQHYTVPEGGYATNPDGVTRILEFRTMVQALHEADFRVAFDVVYNHTSTSGITQNSVLDKVVPGYYHRYNEVSGAIERSTCCENTATEHRMFHKLMVDSLRVWSRDYRIDAFRFDIMGHTPKASILDALTQVRAIDDDSYFYGEGWNFGEVANDRLFEQATQGNLGGTEIGTFNDRPRDFIRDSALFNTTPDPNGVDIIRLGLAGTLSEYLLENSTGAVQAGSQFSRTSYAMDPADIINYVSKHDNETLWDRLQLFMPPSIPFSNRLRAFSVASAIPLLSQGVPFLQLGGDMMRSKSMDRNSFDAGDWFNFVDYSQTTNNWNVGLPLASDNETSNAGGWAAMRAVLANSNTRSPTTADIQRIQNVFLEFLRIRMSSPLFRLTSGAESIARIGFQNTGAEQTPGVILMSIDDGTGQMDLDENVDAIVVGINGTASAAAVEVSTASNFSLHRIQQASSDPVVRTATFAASSDGGTFNIPAYTMAVFVKTQSGAQGSGLVPIPDAIPARFSERLAIVNTADQSQTDLIYNVRAGVYTGSIALDSGTLNFRLQSSDGMHDLGFEDVTVATTSLPLVAASGGAIGLSVTNSGLYLFNLNASASGDPILTVSAGERVFSCADITLANSDQPYPFRFADETNTANLLYVRGNHSEWDPREEFALLYKGENRYQAVATFAATSAVSAEQGILPVQFKLASDDGMWDTQLFVQTATGAINTGKIATGVSHDVAFGDGGTSNNLIDLQADARYSFLLTLTPEPNPVAGANVGNLLVQRCE